MAGKKNGASYSSRDAMYDSTMNNADQVFQGLVDGTLRPLQEARPETLRGGEVCPCDLPTHCFRSVSQRSLTVPMRFASQFNGGINIPIGADIIPLLTTGVDGAIPDGGVGAPVVFANANDNVDRARIYDMVLFALRSKITVIIGDGSALAAGALDLDSYQTQIEQVLYDYIQFKIFHLADRAEPWVDSTPLSAIRKRDGVFMRVPPLLWAERDPSMQLAMGNAEHGAGAGSPPSIALATRSLSARCDIIIEGIWLPDPDLCPDFWPGELCPKGTIGMSKYYDGQILSARKK